MSEDTNTRRKYKMTLTAGLGSVDKLENADKLKEVLKIPSEETRQPDLSYVSAVLVSSGMNLNGAYFLPYELLQAFGSIQHKPFNLEHDGQSIVGHMYDAAVVDRDTNVISVEDMLKEDPDEVNKKDFDIVILATLYKDQFPYVVADVKDGKYAVSMECYYSHYDIIIGDVIIPAKSAGFLGEAEENSFKECELVHAGKSLGTVTVGRVLRNILFSGIGFVESPANPRSIVLEAASDKTGSDDSSDETPLEEVRHVEITLLPPSIIHSSEILSKLVHSNLEVSFAVYTGAHHHTIADGEAFTALDGGHGHAIVTSDLSGDVSWLYFWDGGYHSHTTSMDNQMTKIESDDHFHIVELRMDSGEYMLIMSDGADKKHKHEITDSNGTSYGGSHTHKVKLPNGKIIKTVFGKRSLKKFLDEMKKNGDNWAFPEGISKASGNPSSTSPGQCVSFKKYVYEFIGSGVDEPGDDNSYPAPPLPGASDTITQNMRLKHTNWCALFETECTTLGGDATSASCLRNVLNRTTKDAISNDFELLKQKRSAEEASLELDSIMGKAKECLGCKELSAKWTTKYINTLPNSSFAVVEKGYKEGMNKNARHLPFKDKNGKVDLPHLRNALARANQIKSVLKTESDGALRKRAASKLAKYKKYLKTKSSFSPAEQKIWEECEELYEKNILPLLAERE